MQTVKLVSSSFVNKIFFSAFDLHTDFFIGHVKHANVVVLSQPSPSTVPTQAEIASSNLLANSKSANEYFNRAVRISKNFTTLSQPSPHSNYVKYDIYQNEEKQRLLPAAEVQITSKPFNSSNKYENGDDLITRSSKHNDDVYRDRRPHSHNLRESHGGGYRGTIDSSYKPHYAAASESYSTYDNFPYKSQVNKAVDHILSASSDVPKAEIIEHIKHAVMQYMKELEVEGKLYHLPSSTMQPHTEIKTYFRMPAATSTSSYDAELLYDHLTNGKAKDYDADYEPAPVAHKKSKHYPPLKASPATLKESYSTPSSYGYSSESPEIAYPSTTESVAPHIDITFRSKSRPKPLDLAALDVGQSWSHGTSTETRPKKGHKLHFNSQTYHDINSMGYPSNRGHGEPAGSYSDEFPYLPSSTAMPASFRDSAASVGATISVGGHKAPPSDHALKDLQKNYDGPLHVINGIPISNPYKLSLETLT